MNPLPLSVLVTLLVVVLILRDLRRAERVRHEETSWTMV